MPATAGRIRMPANNWVHSSAALQTHGIWQSAIGYDPYAPTNAHDKSKRGPDDSAANAYDNFQGLLALARVTSISNPAETRGACKKCGRIGHLTYQCRNFLSLKVATAGNDFTEPLQNDNSVPRVDKKAEESDEEEEDDESLSSDSDSSVDEEMEKIIAERFGKMSGKAGSLSMKRKKESNSSDDEEEKMKERKHRRRRNHHRRHRSMKDSDSDSDSVRGLKHKRRRRRERDYDSSSHRKIKKRRRHRERRSVLSSESESTTSSLDEDDERRVRKEKKRRMTREG